MDLNWDIEYYSSFSALDSNLDTGSANFALTSFHNHQSQYGPERDHIFMDYKIPLLMYINDTYNTADSI